MRRHPYSVVLLDEVEKAHPDVWNIFLQILDEGQVTDGKGRVVNMKNTIIIMTSNIGSHLISEGKVSSDGEKIPDELLAELRKYFRIEFLNRIDDIVMYDALTEDDIAKIAHLMLAEISSRLLLQNIAIEWSDDLVQRIAVLGYDPSLGARPLKRAITDSIVNPLSEKILLGEVGEGERIEAKFDEKDNLVVTKK